MPARILDRVRNYTRFDLTAGDPLAQGHGSYEDEMEELVEGAEIVFRRPITLEDAKDAAQSLKDHNSLIVNLERSEQFEARRMVDFICGVCFALDGAVERIGDGIFLFTPPNQRLSVEDRTFLSSGGMFVRDEGTV